MTQAYCQHSCGSSHSFQVKKYQNAGSCYKFIQGLNSVNLKLTMETAVDYDIYLKTTVIITYQACNNNYIKSTTNKIISISGR